MDYRTSIIHTGKDQDPYTGATSIPVYQTSTYVQEDPTDFTRFQYSRDVNPTRESLEHTVATLEGGVQGFAFASGMAAIGSVLLLLKSGDHIVVGEDAYGGTYRLLTTLFKQWGLDATFVDSSDPERIKAAITPKTRAIYVETPSNPILKITDLAAVAAIAREHGLLSIVDNTFMSPYLQHPLRFGFDIVVHSATKFLGGHSDLIAGVVVAREEEWAGRMKTLQNSFGAILGPQDSWLLLRGIKTLAARLDAEQKSAQTLATWLTERQEIKRVNYPTLPGHPGREIHLAQADGGGAVLSFELPDAGAAQRFLRGVRLPLLALSLGGVESIVSYPATMSHAPLSPEQRLALGVSDALVRLSVGLESAEDLKEDLAQALEKAVA